MTAPAPRLHFACDPDFYAMAMSYEDRDLYEGDLHVKCPGWVTPGVSCECSCHKAAQAQREDG